MPKANISLIGMAGVGKSTVGKKLAASLVWDFIDVDWIMREESKRPIEEILKYLTDEQFVEYEAGKVRGLRDVKQAVIAPGGSVVYSPDAMDVLKEISTVVYLSLDVEILKKRMYKEYLERIVGLSRCGSYEGVYNERIPLYEKYADFTIDENGKTNDQVVGELLAISRM